MPVPITYTATHSFVIHEHHAKKAGLHFDLRLELSGVLRSWVLRKTPPIETGVKRLAIPVADHSLSYASFEGTIPRGYGAGTVRIWDSGKISWITTSNHHFVIFHGKKMRGCYTLAPFKGNYLFYKVVDEELEFQQFIFDQN